MAIGNWYAKQASIVVFKKQDGDFYSREPLVDSSTASTTYVDALQLTFTPPDTSDYLIIAVAPCGKTVTTSNFYLRLFDQNTSTAYGERQVRVRKANTHYMPYHIFTRVLNLSGAQDFRLQIKSVTSGVCFIQEGIILALRLNSFPRYEYAESLTRDTTTSTTFQDKTTLTMTSPQGRETLVLSSSLMDGNSTTASMKSQVTIDGAAFSEPINEADSGMSGVVGFPSGGMRMIIPTQGVDMQFKTQYASEDGAMTAGISESRIFTLLPQDGYSVWIKGANILGGKIL